MRSGFSSRSRLSRFRSIVICLIFCGLVLTDAAFAFDRWGGSWKWGVLQAIERYRCAHFRQPGETVVFSNDPAVARLLTESEDYRRGNESTYRKLADAGAASVLGEERLSGFLLALSEADRTEDRIGDADHGTSVIGTVFVHQRQSPHGPSRIVRAFLRSTFATNADQIHLCAHVYSLDNMDRVDSSPWQQEPMVDVGLEGHPATIYAGQPDDNDPSHFTIHFATPGGGAGLIDGWLRDGDRIDWRTAATSPSTSPAAK